MHSVLLCEHGHRAARKLQPLKQRLRQLGRRSGPGQHRRRQLLRVAHKDDLMRGKAARGEGWEAKGRRSDVLQPRMEQEGHTQTALALAQQAPSCHALTALTQQVTHPHAHCSPPRWPLGPMSHHTPCRTPWHPDHDLQLRTNHPPASHLGPRPQQLQGDKSSRLQRLSSLVNDQSIEPHSTRRARGPTSGR